MEVIFLSSNQQGLKITVLGSGTSQGVPVIGCDCSTCISTDERDQRLRSSILVEHCSTSLVVDAGPDFRQQMLRAKVRQLDAILITHTHKDHIAGLDDVRSFNYLSKKPMLVYARRADQEEIKREFSYAFAENPYPGVPQYEFVTIGEEAFHVGEIMVQPFVVMHMSLEVFGFRFGDFAYITDVNYIPERAREILKGVKVLMLDALRKQKHTSHFNLSEAIENAQSIGAELTVFTHISHLMGRYAEVEKELPEGMMLAYDGQVICL